MLIRKQDFAKGFELCEWRWKTKQFVEQKIVSQKPEWNGQKNKRILVYAEQGIGDEIMYASILKQIH